MRSSVCASQSLAICTLLDKPSRREVNVPVEFVGFAIPDEFVVGYGIDYAQRYRHLPYIGKVILLDGKGIFHSGARRSRLSG